MSVRAFPSPVTEKNASQTAHQHRRNQRSRRDSVVLTRINKLLVEGFIHLAVLCGCICSNAKENSEDRTFSHSHLLDGLHGETSLKPRTQSATLKWIIGLIFNTVERDLFNLSTTEPLSSMSAPLSRCKNVSVKFPCSPVVINLSCCVLPC